LHGQEKRQWFSISWKPTAPGWTTFATHEARHTPTHRRKAANKGRFGQAKEAIRKKIKFFSKNFTVKIRLTV